MADSEAASISTLKINNWTATLVALFGKLREENIVHRSLTVLCVTGCGTCFHVHASIDP